MGKHAKSILSTVGFVIGTIAAFFNPAVYPIIYAMKGAIIGYAIGAAITPLPKIDTPSQKYEISEVSNTSSNESIVALIYGGPVIYGGNVIYEKKDTEILESVIVTAIGIKVEKKSIGYAAQEVKADELQNAGEANIVNALSSKVAGVEVISSSGTPGASANITIRGRTSLRNNNSPLFVVDLTPANTA